ncbi:MAG: YgeY family selenium metabolism-linked hydrolase [Acidobacteriia bacterium]|nr:YgeY family selenium metabolism-linked hydrolase [Terriglobia bacterium]
MTALNQEAIAKRAQEYEKDIIKFMRDLIAIPSESSQEEGVVMRIKEEMHKVGFDEVTIDPMGNILGRIGTGKHILAGDAHVDTVGVGNPGEWQWDPFKGKFENGIIYGRGATDQESGLVAMVYGVAILKDLDLSGDFTYYIVGSVQEEDCDGLCWQYIVNEDKLVPECVVLTEPTNMNIHRGHRGRMEIEVHMKGVSCHGSAPERGVNAIYKMNQLIIEIDELNRRLKPHPFLGKGSVTVTEIRSQSPSLCAVPNGCSIHLDRRLTLGETKQSAVDEIRNLPSFGDGEVEVLQYARPSWRGLTYPTEKYYPTWLMEENHPLVQAGVKAFERGVGRPTKVDKWVFSTNGVATMGMFGIPSIGFGPANEIYAHTVNDQVPVKDLVDGAKFFAAFPLTYLEQIGA